MLRGKGRKRSEGRSGPADTPAGVFSGRRLAVAIAVAAVVGGVVAFSVVAWYRKPGPSKSLENWAIATRLGDCDASYDGLAQSVKDVSLVGEKENWCRIIGSPEFIGQLQAKNSWVSGDRACVEAQVFQQASGKPETRRFVMVREGGSWKVDLGADPDSVGIGACGGRVED